MLQGTSCPILLTHWSCFSARREPAVVSNGDAVDTAFSGVRRSSWRRKSSRRSKSPAPPAPPPPAPEVSAPGGWCQDSLPFSRLRELMWARASRGVVLAAWLLWAWWQL